MNYKETPATYILLIINILIWLALEALGSSSNPETLRDFGALTYIDIRSGQYWRYVSAMFLHIGIMHLLVNSISLFILGSLIEKTFGSYKFIAIYIASGIGGSALSYSMISPWTIGAGASGAIFGCLGALGVFFLINKTSLGRSGKENLNAVLIMSLINFGFGIFIPSIDNWAHLGGFISGAIMSSGISPKIRFSNYYDSRKSPKHTITIRQLFSISSMILIICLITWFGNNRFQ
jgi:rhomboid protease GluP